MALRNVQCEYIDESEKPQIADSYTYFFQTCGNNIRSSGNPFCDSFSGMNMFDVARRANDFIKAIRKATPNEDHRICIDAIRNPYEATYFKDIYAAFYLASVNAEERDRKYRLTYLPKEAIDSLDAIEHPDRLKGNDAFSEQNIAACLELTDIHWYNPQREIKENYFLTEQIIRYVMLILHPGLITPTHMERCMQTAYNAKVNSGCLSRQVGAVITDENYSVKAIGWNDVPQGQIPCSLRDVRAYCINKDKDSHSQFEIENTDFSASLNKQYERIDYDKLNGRLHPYCFKDYYDKIKGEKNQVHTRALHAEENAFLQLAKDGGAGIKGGYLFTTASPCELCSKKAYQLGITKIFYIDPYPGISASHILTFGYNNPHNPEMILFYGAIGHAYTMLYSQRIPLKDELDMILE